MARNAYFPLQVLVFPFQLLDSLHAFLLAGPAGWVLPGGGRARCPCPDGHRLTRGLVASFVSYVLCNHRMADGEDQCA